jgi:hypothetical protein
VVAFPLLLLVAAGGGEGKKKKKSALLVCATAPRTEDDAIFELPLNTVFNIIIISFSCFLLGGISPTGRGGGLSKELESNIHQNQSYGITAERRHKSRASI